MSKGEKKHDENAADTIASNKKAFFNFEILEKVEAGLALLGSEVKSLRNRDVSIGEAFVRPRGDELFILGMNIKPYLQANIRNHDPLRPRKLLLHKREIRRLIGKVSERGYTIVPLRLYWKHGIAKVQIATARGRRQFDKREAIRKREDRREIRRAARAARGA